MKQKNKYKKYNKQIKNLTSNKTKNLKKLNAGNE
jgi:hypothetical protein